MQISAMQKAPNVTEQRLAAVAMHGGRDGELTMT
jgi:hypothetical protein